MSLTDHSHLLVGTAAPGNSGAAFRHSTNRTFHYCQACCACFNVKLHENETGGVLLECPHCHRQHYRWFEKGIAIHCDIRYQVGPPTVIRGY